MASLFKQLSPFFAGLNLTLEQAFLHLSHPTRYSLALSTVADLPRSKTQLLAENALLPWLVFLHNHAKDVWACDFLPMIDLFFRQVYLFFIVELGSR